ncbi:MAG: hypothetical protein IJN92_00525 [Lachnospiraceae bacterium]|nr:hypothetical protein [Lachnospiraceae bacterium]
MKKKNIMKRILYIIPFVLSAILFFQTTITTRAYTEEEIEAAKAWLSANGYSPDAGGAAAAYQDYLNGKFGPVPGQENAGTTDNTGATDNNGATDNGNTPETSEGTETPDATQDPGSESSKQGESNSTKKDNSKKNSDDSQENNPEQANEAEGNQTGDDENNPSQTNQGQDSTDSANLNQGESTPMTPEQIESVETLIKQVMEDEKQSSTSANDAEISENADITDKEEEKDLEEKDLEESDEELTLQKEKKEQAKKQQRKAFLIWAASFAGIIILIGVIYYLFSRKR